MHKIVYLAVSVLISTTSISCNFQGSDRIINTISTSNNSKTEPKLAAKTVVISIEGEKVEIPVKLYNAAGAFTTYFPAQDFIAKSVASKEGTSVRFYANFGGKKNAAAYVQIFYPSKTMTVEQLKQWVKSNRGLLTTRWLVDATPDTAYPWVKEKIVFNQAENKTTGAVYLGETQGKAFYVVTHYPVEYEDGFAPRADVILQNLETK